MSAVAIGFWLLPLAAASGAAPTPANEPALFVESSASLGLSFEHRHFGTGEKYMPENMAAGVVLFDANGDGLLDVYFVQGSPLPPAGPTDSANRLFQQRDDGTFEDVTAVAGAGDTGYGMGATSGDYDRDGDLDLYVANFGANVLLRNRGNGRFEDATEEAGVGSALWSMSSGFFDYDRDGDLDLFVVNYLDFAFDNHRWCGNARLELRSYCHPDIYQGLPDVLYRNNGDGTFTDISREAGLAPSPQAKGLGTLLLDFNGDGHQDILVANDSTPNFLYLGNGRGRFEERGLLSGLAFNGAGKPEASMGVAGGDFDGDGRLDVFLTHLDEETNTLYRGRGDGLFVDATATSSLGRPSLPWVGFGTLAIDYDNDGDLDLFVANGHIVDNIDRFDPTRSHRQPAQLFANDGHGRFSEVSERLGLGARLVGRGAAAGDLDRDGHLDLVVTQNGGRALVLVNQATSSNRSLALRLITREGLLAYGAKVSLVAGNSAGPGSRLQTRWLKSASSYLSQSDTDLHFGLSSADHATEITVHWPSGKSRQIERLEADSVYVLREGTEKPKVILYRGNVSKGQ